MGCGSSKAGVLNNIDDSVHVMMIQDKKTQAKKGQAPHAYKPRASNPMLKPKNQEPAETKIEAKTET